MADVESSAEDVIKVFVDDNVTEEEVDVKPFDSQTYKSEEVSPISLPNRRSLQSAPRRLAEAWP